VILESTPEIRILLHLVLYCWISLQYLPNSSSERVVRTSLVPACITERESLVASSDTWSNTAVTSSTPAPGRQNNRLLCLTRPQNSANCWRIMESPTRNELAGSTSSSKNLKSIRANSGMNNMTHRLGTSPHVRKACI